MVYHCDMWNANYKRLGLSTWFWMRTTLYLHTEPICAALPINKPNCAGIWRAHAAGPAKKPREELFAKFIDHQSGSFYSNHSRRYPCRNPWRTSRNLQGKLPIFFWPTSGPQNMHKITIFIIQSNNTTLLLCRWSTALLLRNSAGCVEMCNNKGS